MEFFGSLVGIIFGCTISAVVGALLVMFGAKRILGFSPSYPRAWIISFFHQIISTVINIVANLMFLSEGSGGFFKKLAATTFSTNSLLAGILIMLGLAISVFFAQAGVVYAMINYENKTFKNALKVMGVIWGLIALILIIIAVPIGILVYFGISNS
jgi:hypothetical protein